MEEFLTVLGLAIGGVTIAALLWSTARPDRRIWPPQSYGRWTPIFVWVPTFALFGIIVVLGLIQWDEAGLPVWLRYGVGGPTIALANLAVWYEVARFGIEQTGGAEGTLKTDGLYRYSRNPQYVADAAMIVGWLILSASPAAIPVGVAAIAALLIAPFAEEPWLKEKYGQSYRDYTSKVRRFL